MQTCKNKSKRFTSLQSHGDILQEWSYGIGHLQKCIAWAVSSYKACNKAYQIPPCKAGLQLNEVTYAFPHVYLCVLFCFSFIVLIGLPWSCSFLISRLRDKSDSFLHYYIIYTYSKGLTIHREVQGIGCLVASTSEIEIYNTKQTTQK